MIYLLDANSFIQAKNLHYRMEVVPGFWDWLVQPHGNLVIESIDQVHAELTKHKATPDELHHWAQSNKPLFRDSSSVDIQHIFMSIADYLVTHPRFSNAEVGRFLNGADPWLIAAAKSLSATIVTHEVIAPANSTKVKIPNVAREFGVEWTDIYDLLELSGRQLILKL